MKVSVNNLNKPAPFLGALIGGIAGLAGAGIDAASSSAQQERQMQHDKEMAALNNQYQIDQWNRENEYNLPKNVAKRYRDAGINPRAAFGSGSAHGAGISGGLSSAPGSASSVMYGTNFAGIAGNVLAGARLQAQNKKDLADAKLATEKAESELFDRNFIKPQTARLQSVLADKEVSESIIKDIEAQWAPFMADLKFRQTEGAINSILQGIEESKERIATSKVVRNLKEEERNLVIANINEATERAKNHAFDRAYKKALTSLTKNQINNVAMDTALKSAHKGHLEKLKARVDKEILYLGRQMALTDQQIKKWKNDIALGWSKFGASVAQATSQEVRNWMFGFIPGVKQQSTNFFDDDAPMFAD